MTAEAIAIASAPVTAAAFRPIDLMELPLGSASTWW
jgi:hypothetical protein